MSDSLVIIPTYNEKENIEKMIRKVLSLEPSFHVLLVDDGSPDGTGQIIKDLQKTFPDKLFLIERSGKLGLGTAYIAGFQWALAHHYHFIFEMDADFSHNPEDLIKLRENCANGADLAIGSRYKSGINVVNWPMSRVLLSFYASKYVQFITGMPINDATAGFKCYRIEVLQSIDFNKIKFVGYAFQIEMKFVTWKKGFNIIEVPIIFTDRSEGTSKMSKGIVKEAILGVIQMKLMSYFQKS
jgi:dolichol-phosphate mannosyltransferase